MVNKIFGLTVERAVLRPGAAAIVLAGLGGMPAAAFIMSLATADPAQAASPVSCGGAAMMGGAQLMCSHVDPKAPAQLCTFSWALMTTSNMGKIVDGSFLLPPGSSNVQVYQGSGFNSQLSQPIVLCQGKKIGK